MSRHQSRKSTPPNASKPKLGQNFLVDEAACLRIAEALGDIGTRTVVEIGPGHGAITQHLASRAKRLHCIEFDPALARELTFRFRNDPHVTIHHADILRTDLAALTADGETIDVAGNLPYYITSDILLHLYAAARAGAVRRAVVMMQREVADRIAAAPGDPDYGALSALTTLHADAASLFVLRPEAFSPPPEVFSTVLRLEFRPRFDELDVPFEPFNRFLRSTFAQKRKTLSNNLRAAGFKPEALREAWPPELSFDVRAEAVPIATLAMLFKTLHPDA